MSTDADVPSQPTDVLSAIRSELAVSQPSSAFRSVGVRFGLTRSELGFLAADVYENVMTPDVQALWHWDFAQNGRGHTDAELDALLVHLLVSRTT